MPPKSKSIWRQPNAQHFAVVHRSQRDPLIHDPDAGSHVLTPKQQKSQPSASTSASAQHASPPHAAAGTTRAQLERQLGPAAEKLRPNVGEAATYGIYYDDTEYDYMQHLRPLGGDHNASRGGKDEVDDTEVILLDAPSSRNRTKEKGKGKQAGGDLQFRAERDGELQSPQKSGSHSDVRQQQQQKSSATLELPAEALPSQHLLPRDYASAQAVEDGVRGLQPDMDPHLRQALEALYDDAFLFDTARGGKNLPSTRVGSESVDKGLAARDGSLGDDVADDHHADDQDDQDDDDDDDDDDDIDAFFSEIQLGGAAGDDDDLEWRQLPPEGEESIWEEPAARAARELIQLREQGQGAESLSLEARVALFKAAQARGIGGASPGGAGEMAQEEGNDDDDEGDEARTEGGRGAQRRATSSMAADDRPTPPRHARPPSSVGSQSIFGEKGASRRSRHPGAKARLAASYYAPSQQGGATAFSMSSSAMFRNQGLTDLDERFDRLERVYETASDDDEEEDMDEGRGVSGVGFHGDDPDDQGDDSDGEPQEPLSRDDLDAVLDEFLEKHELVGRRMRERLGQRDATPAEAMAVVREALGRAHITPSTLEELEDDEADIPMPRRPGENREKWDVETILTTNTNLSNHPRLIGARDSVAPSQATSRRFASNGMLSTASGQSKSKSASAAAAATDNGSTTRVPKVKMDPRTGLPKVVGHRRVRVAGPAPAVSEDAEPDASDAAAAATAAEPQANGHAPAPEPAGDRPDGDGGDVGEEERDGSSEDEYDSDATEGPRRVTVARNRNESKEEKKARKQAAKEEKQARREAKAARREQFAAERRRQRQQQRARLAEVAGGGGGGGL